MQKLKQILVFFKKKYWLQELWLYIYIYYLKKRKKKIYDEGNPNYLCFCKARRFVRSLRLKSPEQFKFYLEHDRHSFIPTEPKKFYKGKKWYGPEDFIGIKKDICSDE